MGFNYINPITEVNKMIQIINNIFIFLVVYLATMGLSYVIAMTVIRIIRKAKQKGAIYV
jgi:hypothetical protein